MPQDNFSNPQSTSIAQKCNNARSLPISVGVELEFALAYLCCCDIADENEKHTVSFPVVWLPEEGHDPLDLKAPNFHQRKHFGQLLAHHGFLVNLKTLRNADITNWQGAIDGTVSGPKDDKIYQWTSIELESPALALNDKSLADISKLCELIISNYVTGCNSSTGLHRRTLNILVREQPSLELILKEISIAIHGERQASKWRTRYSTPKGDDDLTRDSNQRIRFLGLVQESTCSRSRGRDKIWKSKDLQ